MKFVLISMIKNESAIIERSLKSVEGVVDAFCVCDTGSTDNTVDIINKFLETHETWDVVLFGGNNSSKYKSQDETSVKEEDKLGDVLKGNFKQIYDHYTNKITKKK